MGECVSIHVHSSSSWLAIPVSTTLAMAAGLKLTCDAHLSKEASIVLKLPSETTKPAKDGLDWALLADECDLTRFWGDCKMFIAKHKEVRYCLNMSSILASLPWQPCRYVSHKQIM